MNYDAIPVSEYLRQRQGSDLEEQFAGQLRMLTVPTPVRQYQPMEERRYKADFAWLRERVIVEIDGGIYAEDDRRKGHGAGPAYERNCEKRNLLAIAGWRVLSGGPNMVKTGQLARHLCMALGVDYPQ